MIRIHCGLKFINLFSQFHFYLQRKRIHWIKSFNISDRITPYSLYMHYWMKMNYICGFLVYSEWYLNWLDFTPTASLHQHFHWEYSKMPFIQFQEFRNCDATNKKTKINMTHDVIESFWSAESMFVANPSRNNMTRHCYSIHAYLWKSEHNE